LGEVTLHFFRIDPERLTGLASLDEQRFFQAAAAQEHLALRFHRPTEPLAERFRALCGSGNGCAFSVRVQLLQLFVESFGADFQPEPPGLPQESDVRKRLAELLAQLPAAELADLDFPELARQLYCTPRHLSRVFHGLVGMSFRDKQTELRLTRARELLATTRSKVLEVALESGYQSLSLFNLLFKRRFGVTPTRWRSQQTQKGRRQPKTARAVLVS
jgi:AraC-like DNA-binding protein